MNNELTMTSEQVKIYVSKHILTQYNGADKDILRYLIFSLSENVNWDEAGQWIIMKHPELTQEFIDNNLVAK